MSNGRLVYLVRHGATEANLSRPAILQGRGIDLPLCDAGRRQAEATRELLRGRLVHGIFSSPLQRSFETAEIIGQPHGLPVHAVPAITECDVGRWEGMSWEQIEQQEPQRCAAFYADPATHGYPGGESFQDVEGRAVPAIHDLVARHAEGNLLVVAHNIVLRVFVARLFGLPAGKARAVRQDNCGVTILSAEGDSLKVVTCNSTFHLAEW